MAVYFKKIKIRNGKKVDPKTALSNDYSSLKALLKLIRQSRTFPGLKAAAGAVGPKWTRILQFFSCFYRRIGSPFCSVLHYLFITFVFREYFPREKQVLLMTFIYSLGIFSVMLPVVLGAKALSIFFFRLHDQTYYLGESFHADLGRICPAGD